MHVPAVSPRELTGTTALKNGIPPGNGAVYKYWARCPLSPQWSMRQLSSAEKQKLVALVRSRQASDLDDSELSAPAAAVYVSHS